MEPITVEISDEVLLGRHDALAHEVGRLQLVNAALTAALSTERSKVTDLERRLEPVGDTHPQEGD